MQNLLSPIAKLALSPQQFDFFQAVRLLMLYQRRDAVRFRGRASLQFPVSAISASRIAMDNALSVNELQITFLGLYGSNGILPNHYTELIIQRLQAKDTSLRDFLDIFNHCMVSLFYRSWEKYHFYVGYERAQITSVADPFTHMLAALIGNGTEHLQNRLSVPDETFLYYADLFAKLPRSASILKTILSDYFAVEIEIEQFLGQWLQLSTNIRTRLAHKATAYNCLGQTVILGQSVWDMQNNFRIKIILNSCASFLEFLPNKTKLSSLAEMTRRYIGIHLNFDVLLILKASEVPNCILQGRNALAWNCWLKSRPMLKNAEDTILHPKNNRI